jgi:hypothetical protein
LKIQFTDVRVGQRISVYYGEGKDNFTGTVKHISPGLAISVVRDDQKRGTGVSGSWRVAWSSGQHKSFYLDLVQDVTHMAELSFHDISTKLSIDVEEISQRVIHLESISERGTIGVLTPSDGIVTLAAGNVLFRFRTPPVYPLRDKQAIFHILEGENWANELFRFLMKEHIYTRIFTLASDTALRAQIDGRGRYLWTIQDATGETPLVDDIFNGTVVRFSELDFQRFFGTSGSVRKTVERRIKLNRGGVV